MNTKIQSLLMPFVALGVMLFASCSNEEMVENSQQDAAHQTNPTLKVTPVMATDPLPNCYVINSADASQLNVEIALTKPYVVWDANGWGTPNIDVLTAMPNTVTSIECLSLGSTPVTSIVDYLGSLSNAFTGSGTPGAAQNLNFKIRSNSTGSFLLMIRDQATQKTIWSYHIWVVNGIDFDASKTANSNWMPYSLGAQSELTPGLEYQWGRKDPFPYTSPTNVKALSSSVLGNQLKATTENPTMYLYDSGLPYDWYGRSTVARRDDLWAPSTATNNYWSAWAYAQKSFYDPCPSGYRVPSKNDWKNLQNLGAPNYGTSTSKYVIYGGTYYFPYSGYIKDNYPVLYTALTKYVNFWTRDIGVLNPAFASTMEFANGYTSNSREFTRSTGQQIRCIKMSATVQ